MAAGFNLVEVNTFRAGQFRKAQGKKAKTDRIDARCIAAILSLSDHKPLHIPEPVSDNLRELTRFRTDLVDEKSMAMIHLREALSILCRRPLIDACMVARRDNPKLSKSTRRV
jgi:transposase